jgi:two-component system, response regulator YesN
MVRALIVDDERMTREALRDFVRWRELGFDEVETARDGVDALERMGRRAPDVVLCDIRMPRMDGLALAAVLRERHPECGLIFLSGHAEKENLKAAIRLQAADFIEKPINVREVAGAVRRVLEARRAQAAASADGERARRTLSELEPLLRESFALALLQAPLDEAALRRRYEPRLVDAFLPGPVRAALVEVPAAAPEGAPRPSPVKDAVRAVNELAGPAGPLAAWPADAEHLGLVLGRESSREAGQVARVLEAVAGALERVLRGAAFRIGVGPPVPGAGALRESAAGAAAALGRRFYEPEVRVLHPAPQRGEAFRVEPALAAELAAALEVRGLERVLALLRRAEARARDAGDADTGNVRGAYLELALRVLEAAPGWDPAELRAEREAVRREIQAAADLRSLGLHAELLATRCLAPGRGAAGDRRIERVKGYVRARYADPDLTVETIAAAAGLSESYLCTVFKHACGVTVKDHVTRVRVERAKDLLRHSEDKLHAVALQVGFRDANYFSTVFKREVGVTPSEYRERAQR